MPKPGYNAGINVCYNISRHIGIETGIQYSKKGYKTKKTDFVFGDNITPGGITPSGVSGSLKYNYHYLDIPVKINFAFGQNKVRFTAGAGIVSNIFLVEIGRFAVRMADGKVSRSSNRLSYSPGDDSLLYPKYNTFNSSAIVSAGLSYRIDDRMSLRVEPTFTYGLRKIIENTPVTAYLWSGGINAAYYIALGKK